MTTRPAIVLAAALGWPPPAPAADPPPAGPREAQLEREVADLRARLAAKEAELAKLKPAARVDLAKAKAFADGPVTVAVVSATLAPADNCFDVVFEVRNAGERPVPAAQWAPRFKGVSGRDDTGREFLAGGGPNGPAALAPGDDGRALVRFRGRPHPRAKLITITLGDVPGRPGVALTLPVSLLVGK